MEDLKTHRRLVKVRRGDNGDTIRGFVEEFDNQIWAPRSTSTSSLAGSTSSTALDGSTSSTALDDDVKQMKSEIGDIKQMLMEMSAALGVVKQAQETERNTDKRTAIDDEVEYD